MAGVILTRAAGKNAPLAGALAELGITPLEIPLLEQRTLPAAERVPDLLAEEWDWVVVTSREGAKILASFSPVAPVAVLGQASAAPLAHVEFMASRPEVAALAAELPGPGRVLYLASAIAGDTLVQVLQSRGFEVETLAVYSTFTRQVAASELKQARAAQLVTLASPSAVRAWWETAKFDLPASCIGATTGDAARQAGFSRLQVAKSPEPLAWAREIATWLSSNDFS